MAAKSGGASSSADPDRLTAALDGGCRLVYVVGDSPLLVDRVVERVEAWGVERCGLPAFNHGRWRASDDRASDAVVTARTVPMMADMRVVVLRDLEQGGESLCSAVVEYFVEPSPSTLFIAVAGPFGKVRKGQKAWGPRLLNAAKKSGLVIQRKAAQVDRVRFAQDYATSVGVTLQPRQATLLIELVGSDLGRLAQELTKVAVYVGPGEAVTGAALEAVCSALAEETVWELTGGIAGKNAAVALRALHRLLADGQDPHYLFAMVCMQLRKVLEAVSLLRRGVPDRQVSSQVRLRWEELRKIKGSVSTAPQAAEVLDRLASANRAMNSSPAGRQRVLEALVVDLCA